MTAKPALLVIDDEPDICDTIAMVLEPVGYEVVSVQSGAAALELLGTRSFDLAITDFMMPGMDGIETLGVLGAAAPQMPVLVVTGFVSEDMEASCRAAGACAVMKKPFDILELRRIVATSLAGPSGRRRP